MDLIERKGLHMIWILTLAQCRRDTRHHCCRDIRDITRGRTVNMAAENSDDPP
jgi:hypothetical protein